MTTTTATLTFKNCTTTYTPVYGEGRMFDCTCGMKTDSGVEFHSTHGAPTPNRYIHAS